MKKILTCGFLAALLLTGCEEENKTHSHGDDERALIFYSSTTNDHYAYNMEEKELINLNGATHDGEDISNFNLSSTQTGKPFVWVDDKGDTDEDNDEQKVVMFKDSYSYGNNGNATYQDFYYIGHFHEEEENGETHHHLAAHANTEFNVTSGAKFDALGRLNTYLSAQNTVENNVSQKLASETASGGLCGYLEYEDHEDKKEYVYAMDQNGKLYVYNGDLTTKIDEVTIASSCTKGEMGLSAVEDGVWVYLNSTKKIYEVDSHSDGVYHIHETMDLSDYLGTGKDAVSMVSIKPAEEHDH